ncbi:MAG: tRNA 2-thiouridine(34) synthase MnmA, partial [Neisseriaceae bacterium]|nr:tRNA 2-thiouridine(34) synthase MnmA [Neisseriaceae bacterium]
DLTLPTANKKDSTGICFIGERPFREFLQKYLPTEKGLMVTLEGKTMGEHVGLSFYTLGQRKGLGIGGNGEPWYVAGKNIEENQLIVVQGHNHPFLFSHELIIDDLSFTLGMPPKEGIYQIKVRYRMQDVEAELTYIDTEKIRLVFKEPVWAATPGQSAVIYQDDVCLGGGIIASTLRY